MNTRWPSQSYEQMHCSSLTARLFSATNWSSRIPVAFQGVYLNASAQLPNALSSDLVSKDYLAKPSPHRRKKNVAKQSKPSSLPRGESLGVYLEKASAADAAANALTQRSLHRAMNEKCFTITDTSFSTVVHAPYAAPLSPARYFDAILNERKYSTQRYPTLQSAYYAKPTELQQACHNLYLTGLVKNNDFTNFERVISSGLVSPNPCNKFGESLLHMVCRRGRLDMLQCMIQAGTCLQIVDDFGRTPLHDACWALQPCWEVVKVLLTADARMMLCQDIRGDVPLDYVQKTHHQQWREFLDSIKDVYWPEQRREPEGAPILTTQRPNSRPVPLPKYNDVPVELASKVAAGQLDPIQLLQKYRDSIGSCNRAEAVVSL
jgi:hypothetical protein